MRRPSSSIKRLAVTAALGMLLAVVAGCGTSPVAPVVTELHQTPLRAVKNPHHANGVIRHQETTSDTGAGVSSGSMGDPGTEEVGEFVIE